MQYVKIAAILGQLEQLGQKATEQLYSLKGQQPGCAVSRSEWIRISLGGGEREEGGDGRRETVPAFEWRIFPPALVKRGDRESTGRFHFKVLRSNY